MRPRTIDDYGGDVTSTSFSALLELETILQTYRESLVLVGGWVPFLLMDEFGNKKARFTHAGSIDIDIAIDPDTIGSDSYAEIVELMEARDYSMKLSSGKQTIPASYVKKVDSHTNGKPFTIQVDFLTAPDANAPNRRHRRVQAALQARKADGCDLAFTHNMKKTVRGMLPGNGETELVLRMLDIPGCIGMKGVVLGDRYKEKDAYDIYSVVSQCMGGPKGVAAAVRPFCAEPSMRRGLDAIRRKFQSIESDGPAWVGRFMSPADKAMRERNQANAYGAMQTFIEDLA